MKRCISLTLIGLLLFNMMGFYGILEALRYSNKVSLLSKLDAERYDAAQTQLIKVPFSLPYSVDQTDYQRVNGDFQHLGNHYRLVKQRVANDTLYIVCILDRQAKKIDNAITEFVKTFKDDMNQSQHSGKMTLSFAKDYLIKPFSFDAGTTSVSVTQSPLHPADLESAFVASITHPPQLA